MAVPIVAGRLTLVKEILSCVISSSCYYSFHSGVRHFLFAGLEPLLLGIVREMSDISDSYPPCFTSCYIFFISSFHSDSLLGEFSRHRLLSRQFIFYIHSDLHSLIVLFQ